MSLYRLDLELGRVIRISITYESMDKISVK